MAPRYVTEEQVAELLTPGAARDAVHASFERLARGAVDNPPRMRTPLPGGVFAVMPCVDRELGLAGLKTYAWLPGGAPFLVVLFSIERAELVVVVEADRLGQLRTAAASAVAAQLLAPDGARSLGVLGYGRQAASHVAALRDALPGLERVLVHGPDAGRCAAFCEAHGCVPAAAAEAGGCDVVVTVTTSTSPVLAGEWLTDGALVLAIGANDPGARELDNAVLERAAFVCTDVRTQAQEEAGDLIGAVAAGVLAWDDVAELQDVVTGSMAAPRGIAVFKSNGLAAWDIAVAARLLELP